MAYAWVVGGSRIQEPLIKEFQSRGVHVCVGDRNPQCYATRIPDTEVFLVDTHTPQPHLEAVKAYAKLMGESPIGVMTAGTDVGPTVSRIANYFSLPGCPYDVAVITKRKHLMRQALGVPHPWWSLSRPTEYPCIVKPTDSSASRGVNIVCNERDFERGLGIARMASPSGGVIIEEWLQGNEASTDWMVVDGFPIYVNGASRYFVGQIETGWINPFSIDTSIQDLANHAVKALEITDGPFKMDLIEDPRYGWVILECATRWSGSFDHTIGALVATGRNLSACLADYAMGLPFDTRYAFSNATISCHVAGYTPILEGNYLVTNDMIRSIAASPHVVEVIPMRFTPGPVKSLADRPLFIITKGATPEIARMEGFYAWQSWLEFERTMSLGGGDT